MGAPHIAIVSHVQVGVAVIYQRRARFTPCLGRQPGGGRACRACSGRAEKTGDGHGMKVTLPQSFCTVTFPVWVMQKVFDENRSHRTASAANHPKSDLRINSASADEMYGAPHSASALAFTNRHDLSFWAERCGGLFVMQGLFVISSSLPAMVA